jgi:prevent-host-death family protein
MVRSEAAMGKMVGIAEFKANCTRLIAEMERDGEPITITKRGRAVAELKPAADPARAKRFLAAIAGTVTLAPDFDPGESMFLSDWEAKWEAKWDERGLPAPDAKQ